MNQMKIIHIVAVGRYISQHVYWNITIIVKLRKISKPEVKIICWSKSKFYEKSF